MEETGPFEPKTGKVTTQMYQSDDFWSTSMRNSWEVCFCLCIPQNKKYLE
jgi:hypothetical protein